ncbi:hypothetical protein GCM10009754_87420 [Amycolatopsis minnesotensis]|uniref:Uncharacterized protein n=1 Tax=Amycolatopsis minnesotensis TaxID=337894 RepID=A0ABP5EFD9_9PSEU
MHWGRLALYLAITAGPAILYTLTLALYTHHKRRHPPRPTVADIQTRLHREQTAAQRHGKRADQIDNTADLPPGWHWPHHDPDSLTPPAASKSGHTFWNARSSYPDKTLPTCDRFAEEHSWDR